MCSFKKERKKRVKGKTKGTKGEEREKGREERKEEKKGLHVWSIGSYQCCKHSPMATVNLPTTKRTSLNRGLGSSAHEGLSGVNVDWQKCATRLSPLR